MDTKPVTGVEAKENLAKALYPEPPPRAVDRAPNSAVAAVRAADPARKMYNPADQLGPNGGAARELALALNPRGTTAQLETAQTQWATVAADIGANRTDVSNWASFAAAFAAKPPTEAETAAFHRTAVKELRETYGPDFDQALTDARAITARDPRLKAMLDRTGLGNHPSVILRFAELGRAARAKGQLK